jgi:hypothetical protein
VEGAENTNSLLVGADEDGGGPLAAGQQLLSGPVPALAGKRCPDDRARSKTGLLDPLMPSDLACVGIGLVIVVLGLVATAPGLFWLGAFGMVIAGIMFARANNRIRQAELEVAKARENSPS